MIRVANAPCSWGVIENIGGERSGYARVLDEMALAGYAGTELGDWGFMPTDPAALQAELAVHAHLTTLQVEAEDASVEGLGGVKAADKGERAAIGRPAQGDNLLEAWLPAVPARPTLARVAPTMIPGPPPWAALLIGGGAATFVGGIDDLIIDPGNTIPGT